MNLNLDQNYLNKLKARLLKFLRINPTTDCWEWSGGRDEYDYGMIKVKGHNLGAHRVAMAVWRGFDLASKLKVLHKCDNPPCINPKHLFLGTQSDNLKDCVCKGRHPRTGRGGPVSETTRAKMRRSRLAWLAKHPTYMTRLHEGNRL